MKKPLRILLLIEILIFICSCGVKKNSESISSSELPNELFQRWKLDYGMVNEKKISGLSKSPNNDYEFKRNGVYLIYNIDETYITGTWEYNSFEKKVYLKHNNGVTNGIIADLKAERLTLIPVGKAIEGTPFENFRFYYIPKTE
ncbi:hypothetical protein [uncultured Psychroserpens sp.]|uniref:hypothetical protein n=1 Tax=uncultured Psychroserpens sp. TaxID=255436 RepID=UPI002631E2CE|nr:hypothetical protein [uncultured Psychroserpens sp.]